MLDVTINIVCQQTLSFLMTTIIIVCRNTLIYSLKINSTNKIVPISVYYNQYLGSSSIN